MINRLSSAVFLFSGLIINFLQLLLHLFLKPISKRWFRSVNYYLCYSLYSQIVFIAEWWSQSKVEIWVDENDLRNYIGKEHGFLITNNSCEIDWVVCWIFADKCNVLGNLKTFVKRVIANTPIIGWAWKLSDCILIEQSDNKDENVFAKQLKEVYSYSDPMWLEFVPEGARFTSERQEESVKFALKHGMPVLKYHLLPNSKSLVRNLQSLRDKCAIYDINIAFRKDEVEPTLSNILTGYGVKAYVFMRRIATSDVPANDDEAAEWLHEMFREKDKILDSFYTTGSFFNTSGFKEPMSFVTLPRWSTLINFLCWTVVCLIPVMYYIVPFMVRDSWFGLLFPTALPMFYYFLMRKVFHMPRLRTIFF